MVREELVEWIYRLASRQRENDPICAQVCTEIETGEAEPGRLATGYCIDRVLVDESKAWAGFYTITRYCQNPRLAIAQLRCQAPWLPECEFDSVEEQARKCLAVRRYIVSTASVSSKAPSGPCISSGTASNAPRGRHPVYTEYLRSRYRRESNGDDY